MYTFYWAFSQNCENRLPISSFLSVCPHGTTRLALVGFRYDILVFLNCNWVVTRWQQYSTHLHTNNTQNDTKQNNTQNNTTILGECGPCPVLASYILAFALTTEEKARKNLSQGSRIQEYIDNIKNTQTTIRIHKLTIRIHRQQ